MFIFYIFFFFAKFAILFYTFFISSIQSIDFMLFYTILCGIHGIFFRVSINICLIIWINNRCKIKEIIKLNKLKEKTKKCFFLLHSFFFFFCCHYYFFVDWDTHIHKLVHRKRFCNPGKKLFFFTLRLTQFIYCL